MQKGIFLQDLNTKSRTVNNAIIQLGDIDDSGKGRKFVSKFIQPGLVKIEGHGIVLLRKETLDESLPTIVGSPVIIQHKDVTEENANELRCGVIANAYFNQPDGWYYVDGIIWDDKAQDLINKGWSVSCSYDYLAFNDEGGEENNIHYDKEFTQLNFTHLAIVDNPRYERANIVFNSKVKSTEVNNEDQWITIHPNGKDAKGKHLLLKDGESPKEAIERTYGNGEKSDTKDKESYNKAKGRAQKALDLAKKAVEGKELSKQEKDWLNSNKSADELSKDKQSDSTDKNSKIQKALGNAISEFYSDDVDISAKTLKELRELSGRDISKDEVIEIADQVTTDHDWDKAIKRLKGSKEDKEKSKHISKDYDLQTTLEMKIDSHYEDDFITKEYAQEMSELLGTKITEDDIWDAMEKSRPRKGSGDYSITKMSTELQKTAKDKIKKQKEWDKKQADIRKQDTLRYDLKSMLKQISPNADYRYDEEEKTLEVRYLGDWEGDDGSGDYDWQTPTQKTVEKVREIKKEFKKRFGYELKSDWSEKNWYYFWIPDNKTNNSKEQDMALIEELKKLIFKVENNKENETMVENEKVDKRKLIDEVAGIMKSAGCDDEDIRTAIGKMEKIGYDDSEASADNKKVKNEVDEEEEKKVDNEEDEKDEKEDKKVDNEDEEDEEKVEELEEEEKKDIKNKCKNSKEESYFDKLNKIYNSAKKVEEPSKSYESRQSRLEAGEKYFG